MAKMHTLKWKQKEAMELAELAKKHKVIAVARIERFPAALFQKIRKSLSGKAIIRVSKTRVFARALKEAGINAEKLQPFLEGSIAIIFTDMDPFELYLTIKKNKGKTAAKAGMIAEKDIVVPKGDTGLPPGPDLADLKAGGLNPQMKGSSIIIPKDVTVTKAGETVTEGVAKALAKLDIKPIEVGLNVSEVLLQKAFRESKALSIEAGIINSATAPEILAKAQAQAQALKALVKPAPSKEEPEKDTDKQQEKTEPKEDTGHSNEKPEEKKEDTK